MEDRDDNKNFYDQFDRSSPFFHNGFAEPVPYNDIKVPKSMPNEFPEGFDPNAPVEVDPLDSHPEVVHIAQAMGFFREFKKLWGKIADSFVHRGQQIEKSGEKDVKIMSKKLREELNASEAFEKQCQSNNLFVGYEDGKKAAMKYIEDMGAGTDFKLAKEDAKLEITKFTRIIFKCQNDCMKLIKDKKKALKEAKKQAPVEIKAESN